MRPRGARPGSALISALFLMTLVAIAATAMIIQTGLSIYRTNITVNSDKLYLATQAVNFWAMETLKQPSIDFKSIGSDGKIFNFPMKLAHIYPDIALSGELYDLQALFNINNLQNGKFYPLFIQLMQEHLPHENHNTYRSLLGDITYWMSPYQPDRGQDENLVFYLHQNPPYLPGHQPFQSVTELRLLRHMNEATYQALLPYLTALPDITKININTAPKEILKALGNKLTDTDAMEIINARREQGMKNFEKIYELLERTQISNEQITLESNYFLCVASAEINNLSLKTRTILKTVSNRKGQLSVSILNVTLNSK
jgi:general secretion pathway protein K